MTEGRAKCCCLATVGLAAALSACGGREGATVTSVVRDSAGVAIVENTPAIERVTFATLDLDPSVDIGSLDGGEPYQLFNVADVTRFADGTIVVADGGSKEVRFFDAKGRFLDASGREGEGPGEFQGLGQFVQVGDSLHIYDWSLRRVSVLDRTGRFVRSYRIDLSGGDVPWVVDGLGNSMWLVTKSFVFRPSEISAVVRDTLPYMLVAPEGSVDTLGLFPGVEFFVYGNAQRTSASSLVFGRMTLAAADHHRVAIGANDRYEIAVYAPDGSLEQIVRRAHTARPVTPADIEAEKARQLEDVPNDNFRRQVEQLFLEMPIPAIMPAFDGLQIDAVGNLWVRDPVSPLDAEATWHVYGIDGRWAGIVATPTDLDVREIGDDYLLGLWKDDLGVEHVRMYTLDSTVGGLTD